MEKDKRDDNKRKRRKNNVMKTNEWIQSNENTTRDEGIKF